jgi:DNA-binding CsgD family transcriptional regulator
MLELDLTRAEVEREFSAEPTLWDHHLMFLPPWRERMQADKLGPWFGPATQGGYDRMLASFDETREAGSLWDRETEVEMDPEKDSRDRARMVQRYDAEKMRRYVERQSAHISAMELEVYFAFYRDGMSKGAIAARHGISKKTVENHLLNLRRRMRSYRSDGQ